MHISTTYVRRLKNWKFTKGHSVQGEIVSDSSEIYKEGDFVNIEHFFSVADEGDHWKVLEKFSASVGWPDAGRNIECIYILPKEDYV